VRSGPSLPALTPGTCATRPDSTSHFLLEAAYDATRATSRPQLSRTTTTTLPNVQEARSLVPRSRGPFTAPTLHGPRFHVTSLPRQATSFPPIPPRPLRRASRDQLTPRLITSGGQLSETTRGVRPSSVTVILVKRAAVAGRCPSTAQVTLPDAQRRRSRAPTTSRHRTAGAPDHRDRERGAPVLPTAARH